MLAFLLISIYVSPAQGTLGFELATTLLQVGVVSVIGASFSMFTFEYQREGQLIDQEKERERQRIDKETELDRQQREKKRDLERRKLEYREDLLKAILNQATASYSAVKKARRLLKARAIIQETGSLQERVLGASYDSNMDIVNDAQFSFEHLAGDVETSKPAFTQPAELVEHFRSIEGYLERLIDEYEHNLRLFSGEPISKELASLPKLRDFVGPSKPSNFRTEVIEPYHKVQRLIRSDLLHPELPAAAAGEAAN
jgi:hypothetical protein